MQHGSGKGFSGGSQKIIEIFMQHDCKKGFSGGSQKIIGVYIWRLEQGAKPPGNFLTLLPIFEPKSSPPPPLFRGG